MKAREDTHKLTNFVFLFQNTSIFSTGVYCAIELKFQMVFLLVFLNLLAPFLLEWVSILSFLCRACYVVDEILFIYVK